MLSWWAVAAVLCLPCGLSYHAQRLFKDVERGQSLLLPCDGSAFRDQEGMVRWEQVEETVVLLRGGETSVAESLRGRVQLPSEEQIREGNWSLVISSVTPNDEDVYYCIFKTSILVSSVWVRVLENNEATVADPFMETVRSIDGSGGGTTDFPYSTDVSTQTLTGTTDVLTTVIDSQSVGTTEESTTTEELTTLIEFLSVGTTDVSTSLTDYQSVGTTDETLLGFQWIDSTDKSMPFSALDDPKSPTESPLLENFPWVRVGLIGGVLLLTSLVMALLGAIRQI